MFDPLDRTRTETTNAGTGQEKTVTFNYLGLSRDVIDEEVAGSITRSYHYSPWGERPAQLTHKAGGTTEYAYYGYNTRTDVEVLTGSNGDTLATYGYNAYGSDDRPSSRVSTGRIPRTRTRSRTTPTGTTLSECRVVVREPTTWASETTTRASTGS